MNEWERQINHTKAVNRLHKDSSIVRWNCMNAKKCWIDVIQVFCWYSQHKTESHRQHPSFFSSFSIHSIWCCFFYILVADAHQKSFRCQSVFAIVQTKNVRHTHNDNDDDDGGDGCRCCTDFRCVMFTIQLPTDKNIDDENDDNVNEAAVKLPDQMSVCIENFTFFRRWIVWVEKNKTNGVCLWPFSKVKNFFWRQYHFWTS